MDARIMDQVIGDAEGRLGTVREYAEELRKWRAGRSANTSGEQQ